MKLYDFIWNHEGKTGRAMIVAGPYELEQARTRVADAVNIPWHRVQLDARHGTDEVVILNPVPSPN